MKAYRSQSRTELGLSATEWKDLVTFIEDTRPRLNEIRKEEDVEAPAPYVSYQDAQRPAEFNPGGWVGTYPGGVDVYPSKLDEDEYRLILDEVAGWMEIWDVPTAAAVLPLMAPEALERRSMLLGYSEALLLFTEEALAHRPPVSTEWEPERHTEPRGPLDLNRTIQNRACGTQDVTSRRMRFSLNHPLNLLLLRFHTELSRELSTLSSQSVVMTSTLDRHHQYHQQFVQSAFPDELFERSLSTDFTDPAVLQDARRESPPHLAELVEIWESYLKDQSLSIEFEQQLNVGIKPVEKLYELWVLTILLDVLSGVTGAEPQPLNDDLHRFAIGSDVILYYNTPLRGHSRILASGLNSHPGRPDYALAVEDEICWIGDAKFSPSSNIGLDEYQRLLSYAVDLMPAGESAVVSILFVGDEEGRRVANSTDYTVCQTPLRPRDVERSRKRLIEELRGFQKP